MKWEGGRVGGRGTKKERREDSVLSTLQGEELTLTTSLATVYGLSDTL